MDTNAPDIGPGYPSKGRARLSPAWNDAWTALAKATAEDRWTDGRTLAVTIGELHGLHADTVWGLFSRAVNAGLLERKPVTVAGQRGPRTRTHYKIKQGA